MLRGAQVCSQHEPFPLPHAAMALQCPPNPTALVFHIPTALTR